MTRGEIAKRPSMPARVARVRPLSDRGRFAHLSAVR